MKKIASFLVDRRIAVMIFMVVLAAVCAFLIPQVEVNNDMTKYLADSSQMKQGIDVMKAEFPNDVEEQTIRVMVDDLGSNSQKEAFKKKLENIPYVSGVTWKADDEDYNKDNHSLFVVATEYETKSAEEVSIRKALDTEFTDYTLVYKSDTQNDFTLEMWVIALALGLLFLILFAMCNSWIEPFLFMLTIGVAIVINLGTNVFQGSISNITFTIAAILQLVLSMDYSIILMNRHRQERKAGKDVIPAMKSALVKAASAIASSSLTTFVGLLMLVFMSFKIGFDLGIVLAKGVLISMLCIFTLLSGLIVVFDKVIAKTQKPSLHPRMSKVAAFEHKFRYVIAAVFVVLFVGSYFAKANTNIVYTLETSDPIAEVFTPTKTLVLLYDNNDAEAVSKLAHELEDDSRMKSVSSYPNTIGDPVTASELPGKLKDLGQESSDLNDSMIKMLYYKYFASSNVPNMTMGSFLTFLADDVVNNKSFADRMDSDMTSNVDKIRKFANASEVTRQMSATELANFFEMSVSDVQQLLLFYQVENGTTAASTLTLPQFVSFLRDEVANDPNYSSRLDAAMLSQINQMAIYTDAATMTTAMTSSQMAGLLGMSEAQAQQLYLYYLAKQKGVETDSAKIQAQMTAEIQARTKAQLEQIASDYTQNAIQHGTDVETAIAEGKAYALSNQVSVAAAITAAVQQAAAQQQAALAQEAAQLKITPQDMVNFLVANESEIGSMLGDKAAQLKSLQQIINASIAGTSLDAASLASVTGMSQAQANQLLLLYQNSHGDTSGWTLSVQQFLAFVQSNVISNPEYSSKFDADQARQLTGAKTIVDHVVANDELSVADMVGAMGSLTESLNENNVSLLYLYHAALTQSDPNWKLTIHQLFNFLADDVLNDPRFAEQIDAKSREDILSSRTDLEDGVNKLVGPNYSRMVIVTTLPGEGAETMAFFDDLTQRLDKDMTGNYYLIGDSAMNYEMSKTFDNEMLLITLLTAISIFLVVAVTFRSLAVPLILVLIVQCGVFLTIVAEGLQGASIYYLALLIVQCILMGATIDYGILFTTYYREKRATQPIREALVSAYSGAIHTILTSGLIVIVVTGILGYTFEEQTVAQICLTISMGATSATLLILFVLPGLLATLDRFVIPRKVREAQLKSEANSLTQ